MMDLYKHKSGAWLRNGTHDKYVVQQISQYKNMNIDKNSVVLDLGGHIGLFARYAISKNANRVVSIEPHPDNCELFEKNCQEAELWNAAVVAYGHTGDRVEMYVSSTDASAHSLVPTRGRSIIKVISVNFSDLLRNVKPSVIKMDIEGYEYDMLDDLFAYAEAKPLQSLAIEFHFRREDQLEITQKFMADMEKASYIPVRVPTMNSKSWNATVVWNGS